MLPFLIEVNHPLVEDDVIVEGAYGESMLAPCETDVDTLNCLAAKHILLPLFGVVCFFY